jgi:hypothetical protein
MLGRIFVPKKDEAVAGWRILHNDELRSIYSYRKLLRRSKQEEIDGWAVSAIGRDNKSVYNFCRET